MLFKRKKISPRRQRVRDSIAARRFERITAIAASPYLAAIAVWLMFVIACWLLLAVQIQGKNILTCWNAQLRPAKELVALSLLVGMAGLAAALYVYAYRPRIAAKASRALALAGVFLFLMALARTSSMYPQWIYLATGTSVAFAFIMSIAYDQRFALGMSLLYSALACLAVGETAGLELFLTMTAGAAVCCFCLREIRTRMKLIEVSILAAGAVFLTVLAFGLLHAEPVTVLQSAASASLVTIAVGIFIQAFLPVIERLFGIATSMTLMDYSDANQPALKKLAMEAPGTFSHSLLVGTLAETAAETIGANGLLCRVGAYYHDIGKLNKPGYFVENQFGSVSRHEQLSPAMSQLVIVGHVKDGIEIAREFGLPSVLRQFIETHHGTTLIEYFYNEARKKQDERLSPVLDSDFRYPGPKPRSKEAAIVMLADAAESAVRCLTELAPTRIEALVHNIAIKRLQDGQFDQCDLTLRELSNIETAMAKSLTAYHHGRIAYPKPNESADDEKFTSAENLQ